MDIKNSIYFENGRLVNEPLKEKKKPGQVVFLDYDTYDCFFITFYVNRYSQVITTAFHRRDLTLTPFTDIIKYHWKSFGLDLDEMVALGKVDLRSIQMPEDIYNKLPQICSKMTTKEELVKAIIFLAQHKLSYE